ncbi:MAG: bifunctional glutamate N-acetyltransferase/amino-acid acetyltransferase ArgJ, partial [Candidatus Omnitrophota bacterium]
MKYILPKGFLAGATHCGIKRFKKDLVLIYSKSDSRAAALFTKNKVKAAPVLVSKGILKKSEPIRAIVVNSGNANCCTGWHGVRDAKKMVKAVAENLNLKFNNVLVSSTGIIGKRLPVDLIENAIPKLVKGLSVNGLKNAAMGILTTDKMRKICIEKFVIEKKDITISGITKGAGMVHPNMATMLCFIMTDANIDKDALKHALREANEESFNSITVDGDMSTNDTVVLMANGMANNTTIKKGTKEYKLFLKALKSVMWKLAKKIVEDGEGATKFVTVTVKNAKNTVDAEKIARSIAMSSLVKTSVHGENPNWGRVASSVGASGASLVKPNKFEIYLDKVCVFKEGHFTHPSKERLHKVYKRKNVDIMVNLNIGKKHAKIWTCDLSKRYV